MDRREESLLGETLVQQGREWDCSLVTSLLQPLTTTGKMMLFTKLLVLTHICLLNKLHPIAG